MVFYAKREGWTVRVLAVLRDGFGDSSTAAAPALRMTGGVCGWSGVFECIRVRSVVFG